MQAILTVCLTAIFLLLALLFTERGSSAPDNKGDATVIAIERLPNTAPWAPQAPPDNHYHLRIEDANWPTVCQTLEDQLGLQVKYSASVPKADPRVKSLELIGSRESLIMLVLGEMLELGLEYDDGTVFVWRPDLEESIDDATVEFAD